MDDVTLRIFSERCLDLYRLGDPNKENSSASYQKIQMIMSDQLLNNDEKAQQMVDQTPLSRVKQYLESELEKVEDISKVYSQNKNHPTQELLNSAKAAFAKFNRMREDFEREILLGEKDIQNDPKTRASELKDWNRKIEEVKKAIENAEEGIKANNQKIDRCRDLARLEDENMGCLSGSESAIRMIVNSKLPANEKDLEMISQTPFCIKVKRVKEELEEVKRTYEKNCKAGKNPTNELLEKAEEAVNKLDSTRKEYEEKLLAWKKDHPDQQSLRFTILNEWNDEVVKVKGAIKAAEREVTQFWKKVGIVFLNIFTVCIGLALYYLCKHIAAKLKEVKPVEPPAAAPAQPAELVVKEEARVRAASQTSSLSGSDGTPASSPPSSL